MRVSENSEYNKIMNMVLEESNRTMKHSTSPMIVWDLQNDNILFIEL